MRISYDGSKFKRRPNVKKMLLLLDGIFTDEHIEILQENGWDSIYYADEIEELIKAID